MVFLMCTTYVSDLIATPFEFAIVDMVVFSKSNTLEYGIKCRWFENYTTKRTQTYVYGYIIIYACFYNYVMSIYFMMIDIKLTIHENHMALESRCSQRISSKRWRFLKKFFSVSVIMLTKSYDRLPNILLGGVVVVGLWWTVGFTVNTLRPRRNGHHFPYDIFKCIFLNGYV